jgi:hypothetical protein
VTSHERLVVASEDVQQRAGRGRDMLGKKALIGQFLAHLTFVRQCVLVLTATLCRPSA